MNKASMFIGLLVLVAWNYYYYGLGKENDLSSIVGIEKLPDPYIGKDGSSYKSECKIAIKSPEKWRAARFHCYMLLVGSTKGKSALSKNADVKTTVFRMIDQIIKENDWLLADTGIEIQQWNLAGKQEKSDIIKPHSQMIGLRIADLSKFELSTIRDIQNHADD